MKEQGFGKACLFLTVSVYHIFSQCVTKVSALNIN